MFRILVEKKSDSFFSIISDLFSRSSGVGTSEEYFSCPFIISTRMKTDRLPFVRRLLIKFVMDPGDHLCEGFQCENPQR